MDATDLRIETIEAYAAIQADEVVSPNQRRSILRRVHRLAELTNQTEIQVWADVLEAAVRFGDVCPRCGCCGGEYTSTLDACAFCD